MKSFIEAATPAAGAAETASVVNEIFLRGSGLQNATVEKVPIEVDNSSQKNSVSKNQNNQANTEPQKVVYENIKKELADNQTVGSGKAGSSADIDSGASEKSTVNLDADANSNSTNSNSSDSNTKVFAKIPGEKKRTIDKDQRLIKVGSGPLKVGDTAIITSRNLPKLPEKISDSYKAFQGSLETVDTPITGAHLILKNHIVAKGRFLEVRVDLDSVKKAPKFDVVVDESPSNDNNEKNDK
ncbi:MAG: hypothetical protein SGJ27_12370 [Candidatus Melainabacteria bacterium]|nr:hypothetical protein [Candidatus Melainabacteria bacterium]